MDVVKTIRSFGVIPVLGLKNPQTAPLVADALCKGGLPLIEVTLRDEHALDCIRAIKRANKEIMVGAGTVLTCEQVDRAKEAGVDFIVSPGFNPAVVKHCISLGLPITPGCTSPTEIEAGLALGLKTFKFFPSEALGGMATIKQLCGPYQDISFVCTGGITFENMDHYLTSNKIAAVGGSFVAPDKLIEACAWEEIEQLCKKALNISLGFSLAHVGINGSSKEEGMKNAQWIADCFGLPMKEGNKSNFAGTAVECCNMKFPGEKGHIAFFTNSPERAEAYFQRKGIALRDEFRNVDAKGNLVAVYLKQEIGGFAIYILRK